MNRNDKTPRLALCLEYPLNEHGGVSVLVRELIDALAEDFRIWLVSPDPPGILRKDGLEGHVSFLQGSHPPSRGYVRQAGDLATRLRSEGIGLAHFHCGGTFGWGNRWPGASLVQLCSRYGIKTVWTDHLTEPPSRAFEGPARSHWISDFLAPLGRAGKISQTRATDAEIAVSDHDRDYLDRTYPTGKPRQRIYHSRLEGTAEVSVERLPVILAVGHLARRKGQHILARAFLDVSHSLPGWELHIAGSSGGDDCRELIEGMCRDHPAGERVRLLGAHDRPMELMKRASVFVQPSLEEALGLALQEAAFCACPAIGTRVGGIPELISDGVNGLLVPPVDPAALGTALLKLCGDESLRASFGEAGPKLIEQKGMTRSRMIDAHRQLYREVMEKP